MKIANFDYVTGDVLSMGLRALDGREDVEAINNGFIDFSYEANLKLSTNHRTAQ